ncbi:MAG: O-antigen ligase family protein [Vicinamibacterales bacterium]
MPQALLALAGWSLFAFAGAYRWTVVPIVAGAAILAAVRRPRIAPPAHRLLDILIVTALLVPAVQLIPLPIGLHDRLSPAGVRARDVLRVGDVVATEAPLTLDPTGTAWSLATALALLLVYWIARDTFERDGGLRQACRTLAWFGLALAVVMFVQRTTSPRHIYGFWAPITRTAVPSPFGPFVNRNDFAAWLLLALPIVLGYGIARTASQARGRRLVAAIESALDARAALLGGAVLLMTAALVASLSRSGLAGLGAGFLLLGALAWRRAGAAGSGAFAVAVVVLLGLAFQYTNMPALAFRLGEGLPADVDGRLAIWRETWSMTRDFLGVGIGLGAFEHGMLVYQRSNRLLFFNHAHNEYLQVLTEGGLALAVPAAAAVLVGAREAFLRLRRDEVAVFWIRAGALSGIVAVAIQSLWDTGLRMPANGVLFAIAAAVATHGRRSQSQGARPRRVRGETRAVERPTITPLEGLDEPPLERVRAPWPDPSGDTPAPPGADPGREEI